MRGRPSKLKAAEELLRVLGVDLEDENFEDTPRRLVSYLEEFMQGGDPTEVLRTGFSIDNETSGMVIEKDIPFRGMCAHHLAVFYGKVHIGYIPNGRVVGLSKLCRLVELVGTKAPSLQEFITDEIADSIKEVLEPRGVIVVASAVHTCMSCRGVRAMGVETITSAVRGVFRDVPAARQEFLSLIGGK